MKNATLIALAICLGHTAMAHAANGSAEAGRQLVMRSCSSCHATESAKTATDNAPPFAAVAKTTGCRLDRGLALEPSTHAEHFYRAAD